MEKTGKRIPLEQVRQMELDVLLDVASFCEREGLHYSLCAGTLLGAVRHQGFIPWDDDIDVMMPREDFERFVREYRSERPFRVTDARTEAFFPFPFAVVSDSRTVKVELKLRRRCTRTLGVGVDIFPLDPVPGRWEDAVAYYGEIHRRWRWMECAVKRFGKGESFFSTVYRNLFIAAFRVLEALGLTSVAKAVGASRAVATLYRGTEQGRIGVTSIYHYDVRESHPAWVYDGRTDYRFEGHVFKGLLHAHEYLTGMYGEDYMQLPPEEKRVTHHTSDCYWKENV